MFTENLKEQVQYCISTECFNCKLTKNELGVQKCKYLSYKIDELNSNEKYGAMSSKAKRKMWYIKGGVSRGTRKNNRRRKVKR